MKRRFATAADDLERWRDSDWARRYAADQAQVRQALVLVTRTPALQSPALLARLVAAMGLLETFAEQPSLLVQLPLEAAVLRQAPQHIRAEALQQLVADTDTGGRKPTGVTAGIIFVASMAWASFWPLAASCGARSAGRPSASR